MSSLSSNYKKLVEDVQTYILLKHQKDENLLVEPTSYSYFQTEKIVPVKAAAVKPKEIIPPSQPVEILKQEKLPIRNSQISESAPPNFSEIEPILKKIAPNLGLSEKTFLTFLIFDECDRGFLNKIAKAIETQLSFHCKIETFNPHFTVSVKTKFFIANIESIEKESILKENFRISPNQSNFYLAGVPVIPLENEAAYESEPQKKRVLWNQIKAQIHVPG